MSFRLSPLIRGSAPSIVLQRPVLLIGRHDECDVRINSPKVSRRHCCLAMAYDRVLIRDLGSRNGVRVNGREIDESRLYEGDELAIGPILFRLEALDDNPETIGVPPSRRAPSPQPAARAIPTPPSIRPAAAGPARSSRPDSDIDLVPLDED
jgi:pSer/pThr/pTyr-binding forkhead associated (FHA) protein